MLKFGTNNGVTGSDQLETPGVLELGPQKQ